MSARNLKYSHLAVCPAAVVKETKTKENHKPKANSRLKGQDKIIELFETAV